MALQLPKMTIWDGDSPHRMCDASLDGRGFAADSQGRDERSIMLRRLRITRWPAIAFGLAACSGGPGGDGLALGTGNTDADSPCEETRTPVNVLEQVGGGLGFSAVEVLAFSAKEHQSVLRWPPVQHVTYGPESGDVAVSVSVRYAGGPIEFVESTPRSFGGDVFLDIGPAVNRCANALAIEVEVELTTAEGALEERFTAELRANSALSAELVQAVELDALDGTFEVMLIEDPERANPGTAELVQPKLRITFSELGTQGRFEALFQERSGSGASGVASGGLVEFARWPAGNRCGDGSEVPLDASVGGWSPAEVLAELNALSPAVFRWTGGGPTQLTLELQAVDDFTCAYPSSGGFSLQAEAHARTADGRFHADLPAKITWTVAQPVDPAAATSMLVRLNREYGVAPLPRSSVEAMFPNLGVDLSAYEQLLVSFGALYWLGQDAASSEAASGGGSLTLVGSNPAPVCTDEEFEAFEEGRPTRDCSGREDTTLASGQWTGR